MSEKIKTKGKKRRSTHQDISSSTTSNNKPQHQEESHHAKHVKREDKVKKELPLKTDSHTSSTYLKELPVKSDPSGENSILIRVKASNPSPQDPIVVSFPAGLPSSLTSVSSSSRTRSVQFEDDNENSGTTQPPVFTWTKARQSSSKGRIIHGSDDTCTYISSNEGKGYDGRLTKFYTVLYHRPTATMTLIPSSEKGTVFAMEQSVTNYTDSKSLDFRNLSVAERRRMVFESFGSQKKKKVLRSQQANVVEMKSVVGAGEGMMKALGKQMSDHKMSESNLKVMEELKMKKDGDGDTKVGLILLS